MSWIKMRTNLHDDPRVKTVKRMVSARNVCSVTGALLRLWSVGDEHSVDGRLQGYTADDVNEMVGIPGFAEALATPEVDWLDIGVNYVTIKRFEEHNGSSAKQRAQGAERQKTFRERNAPSVTAALPDKIREDKSSGASAPRGASADEPTTGTPGEGVDAPGPKSAKARRPRTPTGDHAVFIDFFTERWRERYGEDYAFADGKDGAHVAWILRKVDGDVTRARAKAGAYLRDADPYLTKERHPLGVLVSRFNKYPSSGTNGTAPRRELVRARIDN